jgi:drug/metabolite transporter (DMT)-like permease
VARAAPFLVLLVGVLAASASSILVRYAQEEGIASLAIAAWRMALAGAVVAALASATRRDELRRLHARDLRIACLAGLFLSAHFVTWITSLEYTSVASSAALVTTNPIWVGLATVFLFRERLPRLTVAGIAISLAGCLLIIWVDVASAGEAATGRRPLVGNLLALAGALGVSAYLLAGRRLAPRLSLLGYIALVYGVAGVLLVAAAVAAGVALHGYSAAGWWALAGLAVGPQLIGHTAFNWALRRLRPTFVALSILGEPVGSAALAGVLLGEVPSGWQLGAFAVLLAGIAVAALGERPVMPSASRSPRA